MRFRQIIVVAMLILPGSVSMAHAETRMELIVGDTPLTQAQERRLKPKQTFRECKDCPEMVVLPAASFTMGSPETEKDRWGWEGPQHVVTIGKPLAVGKLPVTVDQFDAFAKETGYPIPLECWSDPSVRLEGTYPVMCVNWADANAYAGWLAKKTGKQCRLLSEAEFEYATRGQTAPGTYPRFWFGDDEKLLCLYGNVADEKARDKLKMTRGVACNDGYAETSPAGHYKPNAFGLYDMFGNANQWTADCWHNSYNGAPTDGSAWTTRCEEPTGSRLRAGSSHIIRGGSWINDPRLLRAAMRMSGTFRVLNVGFRVARTTTP